MENAKDVEALHIELNNMLERLKQEAKGGKGNWDLEVNAWY